MIILLSVERGHEAKISGQEAKITVAPAGGVRGPARQRPGPQERDRGAACGSGYQPVLRKIAEVSGPGVRTVSPSPICGVMSELRLPAR